MRPGHWKRTATDRFGNDRGLSYNGQLRASLLRGQQMSFGLYIAGFAIMIVGLAIGAHLAHMPSRWIAVGVIVMVGIGIVKGVAKTRRPDPS
jgi:hypothetical protein